MDTDHHFERLHCSALERLRSYRVSLHAEISKQKVNSKLEAFFKEFSKL